MKQRAITAVFFVAAMLGGIYGNQRVFFGESTYLAPFFWLFSIIVAGCLWELMGMMLPADEPLSKIKKVAGVLIGFLPFFYFSSTVLFAIPCARSTPSELEAFYSNNFRFAAFDCLLFVAISIFFLFLLELFSSPSKPFSNIGTYLLGVVYISVPFSFLVILSTDFDLNYSEVNAVLRHNFYPNRVFGLLWLVWTNDTAAYIIGSKIGRTKLFGRISPKKTWEGTVGGAICTVGMAWVLAQVFPSDFTVNQWLVLGAVVGMFGTLGDLVESMLKRSVGVKDSGTLLPGHGGLLDRFDAFIFVLPFAWLALQMFK